MHVQIENVTKVFEFTNSVSLFTSKVKRLQKVNSQI